MTRPDVKYEVAWDSSYATAAASRTWTDITDYVKTAEGVRIGHARQDEFSQPGPNTCSLTLNNSDGRFTPGLASSPYYPNVKIGRPLRVVANLLTAGDYGTFEADITGFVGNNATLAQASTAHAGSWGMSVTAVASANMSANAPTGTSGIPVLPSTSYRASSWVRKAGAATGRTTEIRINWYDSGGTLISTSTASTITDSNTWQLVTNTATSPSNAAYAAPRPFWTSPTAGEVHYCDDVRLDVDRFTGYVDEWPIEWPGVVSTFATSSITATSRMARLGLSDKLKSVVEEEILPDAPVAYYTMGEASGATQANDSSGNDEPPLRLAGAGADTSFGSATGPGTDGLTAAEFAAAGKYLRRPSLSGVKSFEFFLLTKTAAAGAFLVLQATPDLSHAGFTLTVDASTGVIEMLAGTVVATSAAGAIVVNRTHHVHIRVDSGSGTGQIFVDGAEVALDTAIVGDLGGGSIYVAPGTAEAGSPGYVLSHLAAYDYLIGAARIAAHADAGLDGFASEAAYLRLARYAAYAGIPAAEYSFDTTAVTPMAHVDTTGKGPVELMQTVATTDGGVLYDSPGGVLTYASRTVRYNSATALTLDVSAGEVEASYSPKLDRSALINKVTATISDGTYSVTAENATSSGEYGVHSPGDLELATTDNDEAHAAAWWRVNTYGEPTARAPQLGVELARMSATRHAAILDVGVGDKIAVSNLPSQSDASSKSFFCEGYTETITDSQWRIEFNVSPTTGFEVFEIGHATYGQYDAYPIAY